MRGRRKKGRKSDRRRREGRTAQGGVAWDISRKERQVAGKGSRERRKGGNICVGGRTDEAGMGKVVEGVTRDRTRRKGEDLKRYV